ncbi:hypothetical protein FACS1894132_11970 [Clostridia bacterium]|nr:hypothetical protein FACS1894132_11970 [Clostridia bacterium]
MVFVEALYSNTFHVLPLPRLGTTKVYDAIFELPIYTCTIALEEVIEGEPFIL